MKGSERIKRFNQEVSDLKRSEQLKFNHTIKVLTVEEVMNGRSNAYDFIDLSKL